MANKYIEKFRILCEAAGGIERKLACTQRLVAPLSAEGGEGGAAAAAAGGAGAAAEGAPQSLANPEWAKVRKALERAFPETAENMNKLQGYDSFQAAAAQTMNETQLLYYTTLDLLEFKDMAVQTLREVPQEILDHELDRTKNVSLLVMELFVRLNQVLLAFAGIEEKKAMIALFAASFGLINGHSEPEYSRITTFFQNTVDMHRRLVEDLHPISTMVGDMCFQMMPTLMLYFQPSSLRDKALLNPIENPADLALPTIKVLSNTNTRSLHHEMANIPLYINFICYSALICPSVMYREQLQPLFQMVFTSTLEVPVIGPDVRSLHVELEQLASWYPPRGMNVTVPRNFKLKNVAREWAREAAASAAEKHQEIRSYIYGELRNLHNLIETVPGVLGPKFPMIVCALSMAKTEILWLVTQQSGKPNKKRDKGYDLARFEDPTICLIIYEMSEILALVRKFHKVVRQYYVQYLQITDRRALTGLVNAAQGEIAQAGGTGVVQIMEQFFTHIDALNPNRMEDNSLGPFRLNWDRVVSVMASNTAAGQAAHSQPIRALMGKMHFVYEHTRYVDRLDQIMAKQCELGELMDMPRRLMHLFRDALRGGQTHAALAFTTVLNSGLNLLHPDCPEEQELLVGACATLGQRVIDTVCQHIVEQIQPLWEQYETLDQQIAPVEAANRIERMAAEKRKGAAAPTQQFQPGTESHAWGLAYLAPLISIERDIAHGVSAINQKTRIVVANCEFCPPLILRQEICEFLRHKIMQTLFPRNELERGSTALRKLTHGCRAIQTALSFMDTDVSSIIRSVFCGEFGVVDLPPVDQPLPLDRALPQAPSSPLDMVANWMIGFVRAASSGQDGGNRLVYVESKHSFAVVTSTNPLEYHTEHHMDLRELRSLCYLIGLQGARSLEAVLLSFIADHVRHFKQLMAQNSGALQEFSHQYLRSNWAESAKKVGGTVEMLQAAISLGVAFVVRDMLTDAIGEVQQVTSQYIRRAGMLALDAVDNRLNASVAQQLACLTHSAGGKTQETDLALAAALAPLNSSAEDEQILSLLPYVFPALLISEFWTQSNFIVALDAFARNEHTIALTVRKMLDAFGAREGNTTVLDEMTRRFVKTSSFVLLRMKMHDSDTYAEFPVRAMCTLLEKFVRASHIVERSLMEATLPYCIMHSSYVDVSLGRQRGRDVAVSRIYTDADDPTAGDGEVKVGA